MLYTCVGDFLKIFPPPTFSEMGFANEDYIEILMELVLDVSKVKLMHSTIYVPKTNSGIKRFVDKSLF